MWLRKESGSKGSGIVAFAPSSESVHRPHRLTYQVTRDAICISRRDRTCMRGTP